MIVAFSTSSPVASVALIDEKGRVLCAHSEEAAMRASGACMSALERLLIENKLSLSAAEGFVADLGPGSFTGVRVGVTLAKTLAWTCGKKTAGLASFDLIDPRSTVVVPSKKGEWFVRRPGRKPERTQDLPLEDHLGYGLGMTAQLYPDAKGFAGQLEKLDWLDPERLLPLYLMEPSISTPKKPYAGGPLQ